MNSDGIQLSLAELQLESPTQTDNLEITKEGKFEAFHISNPQVYEAIMKVSVDLKNIGIEKCSMWLIFNRLRWLYAIQTKGDEYKLNNNHAGYYARLAMAREPELKDFFQVRQLKDGEYIPDLNKLFSDEEK